MKQTTKDALDLYVRGHKPPGDFLEYVLSNNLVGAIHRADPDNLRDFAEIVRYMWEALPSECWGSTETVRRWLARKPATAEVTA